MSVRVDQPAVQEITVASEDTQGESFDVSGVMVPVLIPQAEVSALLDAYDPDSQYSPSAADARILARVLLDAVKKYTEG